MGRGELGGFYETERGSRWGILGVKMGEQTPEVREEGMGGTGDSRGQHMGSAGGREKEEGRRGTPGGRQRGVRGGRRMEGPTWGELWGGRERRQKG